jgi:hypothetical protein
MSWFSFLLLVCLESPAVGMDSPLQDERFGQIAIHRIQTLIQRVPIKAPEEEKLKHFLRRESRLISIRTAFHQSREGRNQTYSAEMGEIYRVMNTHEIFQSFETPLRVVLEEMLQDLRWLYPYPKLREKVLEALEMFAHPSLNENIWSPGSRIIEPLSMLQISAFLWKRAQALDQQRTRQVHQDPYSLAVFEWLAAMKCALQEGDKAQQQGMLQNIFHELQFCGTLPPLGNEEFRFFRLQRKIERKLLLHDFSSQERLLSTREERLQARIRSLERFPLQSHDEPKRTNKGLARVLRGLNQLEKKFIRLPLGREASLKAVEGWMREAHKLWVHEEDQTGELALRSLRGLCSLLDHSLSEDAFLGLSPGSSPSLSMLDVATLVWHASDTMFFHGGAANEGWVSYLRRQFVEGFLLFLKGEGALPEDKERDQAWLGSFLSRLTDQAVPAKAHPNVSSEAELEFQGLKNQILEFYSGDASLEDRLWQRALRMHERTQAIHWQRGLGLLTNSYDGRSLFVARRLQSLEFDYLAQPGLGPVQVRRTLEFFLDVAEREFRQPTFRGEELALNAMRGLYRLVLNEDTEQWLLQYPIEISNPLSVLEILTLLKHRLQTPSLRHSYDFLFSEVERQKITRRILILLEASVPSMFEQFVPGPFAEEARNVPFNMVEHVSDLMNALHVFGIDDFFVVSSDAELSSMSKPERMEQLMEEAERELEFLGLPPLSQRLREKERRKVEREHSLRRATTGPEFTERSLESVMMSPVRRHILAALNKLEDLYGPEALGLEVVEKNLRSLLIELKEMFLEGGKQADMALAALYGFRRLSPLVTEGAVQGALHAPLSLAEVFSLVWRASEDGARVHGDEKHLKRLVIQGLAESQASQTDHNGGQLDFSAVTRETPCCDTGFFVRLVECLNGFHELICFVPVTNADMSRAICKGLEQLAQEEKEKLAQNASELKERLLAMLLDSFPAIDFEGIQSFVESNFRAIAAVL